MGRILMLYKKGSSGADCSGNLSTMDHIKSLLCAVHHVDVTSTDEFLEKLTVMGTSAYDALIGIHLYHFGKIAGEIGCEKCVIIVGGTDVNDHRYYGNEDNLNLMKAAVRKSSFIVCFTSYLQQRCLALFGDIVKLKLKLISPSVTIFPQLFDSPMQVTGRQIVERSGRATYPIRGYFLIVANLRPVKDVLFIVNKFSDAFNTRCCNVVLVIVGAVIDEDYGKIVLNSLNDLSGIIFLGPQSRLNTQILIRDATALINSSVSEGLSVAILEAMSLGTIVIARMNPGNCAVINHLKNGLLFQTDLECIDCLCFVMHEMELARGMSNEAVKYIDDNHGVTAEQSAYLELCQQLL